MNTSINDTSRNGEPREHGEARERNLTAADSAASANRPLPSPNDRCPVTAANTDATQTEKEASTLAPLFTEDAAKAFRSRWDVVQRGFVDDPQAVQAGDELVAQVIKSLAESFSEQRSTLEGELNQTDRSSTENLRLALRRYRSFFERLLAI